MLRSIALLLTAVLMLTGCQSATGDDPAPQKPPLRLLVAGDSLADGYYASTPDRGFATLLTDRLDEVRDVTPVVVGVSGARAFRVAAAVETETAGEHPFDVVVLEVGANDVGKSTMGEWADGYTRLLDAVAATSPDAQVVCLGPWNEQRATRPYLDVVRRLCDDQLVLSLGDLFGTAELRGPAGTATELGLSDDFHPNDRGHAAIADRVLDGVILD